MGISQWFSGKTPKFESIQVSDWLLNMRDELLSRAAIEHDQTPSSPEVLVYWILINSTVTVEHILHTFPQSIRLLGEIYKQARVYYESFLHLALDRRSESEEDSKKVGKLVADVRLRTTSMISAIFEPNPKLAVLLKDAIGKQYDSAAKAGSLWYMSGLFPLPDELKDDNELVQSTTVFSLIVASAFKENKVSLSGGNLHEIIMKDTGNAMLQVFFTQFRIEDCKFLELPDEYYG